MKYIDIKQTIFSNVEMKNHPTIGRSSITFQTINWDINLRLLISIHMEKYDTPKYSIINVPFFFDNHRAKEDLYTYSELKKQKATVKKFYKRMFGV